MLRALAEADSNNNNNNNTTSNSITNASSLGSSSSSPSPPQSAATSSTSTRTSFTRKEKRPTIAKTSFQKRPTSGTFSRIDSKQEALPEGILLCAMLIFKESEQNYQVLVDTKYEFFPCVTIERTVYMNIDEFLGNVMDNKFATSDRHPDTEWLLEIGANKEFFEETINMEPSEKLSDFRKCFLKAARALTQLLGCSLGILYDRPYRPYNDKLIFITVNEITDKSTVLSTNKKWMPSTEFESRIYPRFSANIYRLMFSAGDSLNLSSLESSYHGARIIDSVIQYGTRMRPIDSSSSSNVILLGFLGMLQCADGYYVLVDAQNRHTIPFVEISKSVAINELKWLNSLPGKIGVQDNDTLFNLGGRSITSKSFDYEVKTFQHRFYRAMLRLRELVDMDLGKLHPADLIELDDASKLKMVLFVKTFDHSNINNKRVLWRKGTIFEKLNAWMFSPKIMRQFATKHRSITFESELPNTDSEKIPLDEYMRLQFQWTKEDKYSVKNLVQLEKQYLVLRWPLRILTWYASGQAMTIDHFYQSKFDTFVKKGQLEPSQTMLKKLLIPKETKKSLAETIEAISARALKYEEDQRLDLSKKRPPYVRKSYREIENESFESIIPSEQEASGQLSEIKNIDMMYVNYTSLEICHHIMDICFMNAMMVIEQQELNAVVATVDSMLDIVELMEDMKFITALTVYREETVPVLARDRMDIKKKEAANFESVTFEIQNYKSKKKTVVLALNQSYDTSIRRMIQRFGDTMGEAHQIMKVLNGMQESVEIFDHLSGLYNEHHIRDSIFRYCVSNMQNFVIENAQERPPGDITSLTVSLSSTEQEESENVQQKDQQPKKKMKSRKQKKIIKLRKKYLRDSLADSMETLYHSSVITIPKRSPTKKSPAKSPLKVSVSIGEVLKEHKVPSSLGKIVQKPIQTSSPTKSIPAASKKVVQLQQSNVQSPSDTPTKKSVQFTTASATKNFYCSLCGKVMSATQEDMASHTEQCMRLLKSGETRNAPPKNVLQALMSRK